MARNVNVNYGNFTTVTGTRAVQRYSVSVQLSWVNNDGTPGSYSGTIAWPEDLQAIPAARLKRYAMEIILSELRIRQGIDVVEA